MRIALAVMIVVLSASAAFAGSIGPSTYVQESDSPWYGWTGTYFHLEDFEDQALDTPGLSVSGGFLTTSGFDRRYIDSVDFDDGVLDGYGLDGESWFFSPGSTGLTFSFSAATLGILPTHAGLVWTDGDGTTTFEAFDENGLSLGTVSATHATPGSYEGQTDSDRFYGWTNAGGISAIKISNSTGGIEADHVQYGHNLTVVPLPAAAWMGLGLLGLLGAIRRRR